MSASQSSVSVSFLVNRHLSALVTEARRAGIGLDDLTIELAAHASCAALSYWTSDDLHGLVDAAAAELEPETERPLDLLEPAGCA
jgi:hypothetical protein